MYWEQGTTSICNKYKKGGVVRRESNVILGTIHKPTFDSYISNSTIGLIMSKMQTILIYFTHLTVAHIPIREGVPQK